MGIKNLSALLNLYAPKSISKKQFIDLTGKKIAIDASLLIYSYVIAIRNTSSDLTNTNGDMTSHIHAVVSKTLLYLEHTYPIPGTRAVILKSLVNLTLATCREAEFGFLGLIVVTLLTIPFI
jgi:hypothetical protein